MQAETAVHYPILHENTIEKRLSGDSGISLSLPSVICIPKPLMADHQAHNDNHALALSQAYTNAEEELPNSSSLDWTPMRTWDPRSTSWSLGNAHNTPLRQQPHYPFANYFLSWKYSRKCCMKVSIIGISCCCILSAFIAFILHFILKPQVNYNAGARGGIPRFFEGPIIPVFGLLNSSSNTNKLYVGANIDWFRDDPQHFNQDLGYDSQIHTASFEMNQDNLVTEGTVNSLGVNHTVPDVFLWTASLIKSTGAIMQIQLIPTVPLSLVTFEAVQKLAEKCRQINEMGVPILLNFAPEMNGNWFIYGQDPINFKNVFQIVSVTVRNITNNTAIVWSPSSSVGSPWKSGKYYPFKNQSSNDLLRFSSLDTNNDGQFTDEDDCFKPYFPGHEFVDCIFF